MEPITRGDEPPAAPSPESKPAGEALTAGTVNDSDASNTAYSRPRQGRNQAQPKDPPTLNQVRCLSALRAGMLSGAALRLLPLPQV